MYFEGVGPVFLWEQVKDYKVIKNIITKKEV